MRYLFIGCVIFPLCLVAKPKTCGKIKSVKGIANILRIKEGERAKKEPVRFGINAKRKMKIYCDDVLSTEKASRMKISLKKALLSIGPKTRLFVEEYNASNGETSVIKMNYGKVRTFFKKESGKKKSTFKVKTPTTVSGVRGTDFYVSYEPNKAISTQATIKGEIEVEHISTKKKVLVDSGKQAVVKPNIEDKINTGIIKKNSPEALTELKQKKLEGSSIEVRKIEPPVVKQIKDTSVLAKNEEVFSSQEAKEILGKPENWEVDTKEIPEEFQGIDNEF